MLPFILFCFRETVFRQFKRSAEFIPESLFPSASFEAGVLDLLLGFGQRVAVLCGKLRVPRVETCGVDVVLLLQFGDLEVNCIFASKVCWLLPAV